MSNEKKVISSCEVTTPQFTTHHVTNYGKNYTINCDPSITCMTNYGKSYIINCGPDITRRTDTANC